MSMPSMKLLVALTFLLSIVHNYGASDAQSEEYCIADEQTPDDQLVGTINWACSNGANCTAIQENQPCFLPNTPKDHASYAFNSFYQNTKHNGGSCYFNAAGLLTEEDPSHDSCKFEYVV